MAERPVRLGDLRAADALAGHAGYVWWLDMERRSLSRLLPGSDYHDELMLDGAPVQMDFSRGRIVVATRAPDGVVEIDVNSLEIVRASYLTGTKLSQAGVVRELSSRPVDLAVGGNGQIWLATPDDIHQAAVYWKSGPYAHFLPLRSEEDFDRQPYALRLEWLGTELVGVADGVRDVRLYRIGTQTFDPYITRGFESLACADDWLSSGNEWLTLNCEGELVSYARDFEPLVLRKPARLAQLPPLQQDEMLADAIGKQGHWTRYRLVEFAGNIIVVESATSLESTLPIGLRLMRVSPQGEVERLMAVDDLEVQDLVVVRNSVYLLLRNEHDQQRVHELHLPAPE